MEISGAYLRVSIPEQRLELLEGGRAVMDYRVSTARNGPGELRGSECTPRGWHVIRARIGEGQPAGSVFVGRRPTGEIYTPELAEQFPGRDWILTRILWLGGIEPGFNRYGPVDTAWRFIYIHGSPDSGVSGEPASHGCIRMTSQDVLDLFSRVAAGTRVQIVA
ncbi:L,D-transpeptidase [Methyloterricola oryzae]|uniref:L,D-transpeptidase n=1 Tax=Methyloterricola oryzae TaxID=1495050 RepID=UPI0005EACC9B|nr:L,D-transpeptidase [Methyloterricola oryzae]